MPARWRSLSISTHIKYIYIYRKPARLAELLTEPLGPGACRQPLTETCVYDMTSRRLAWSCSWTPPMEFSRDGQTSVLPTAELQFKTPTHSQRAPEEGSTPCGLHWPSKTCPAVPPWSRSAAPRTATDACPSCRTVRSGNGQSLEPSVSLSAWMRYRSGNCESALHRAKSQRSVPGTWHFFFFLALKSNPS